jgi:hypothetical protein
LRSAVTNALIDTGRGGISFEAFGVTMSVATNRRAARDRLPEILPPGWRPCPDADAKHRLAIVAEDRGTYAVDDAGVYLFESVTLDTALEILEREVRVRIAREARDRIFIHAGVVGRAGGALLLPGSSFTGKTTLVAALVRAGATYYSDEYAALDDDGLVHPYAKPLSLRVNDHRHRNHHVESLGGTAGDRPLPVRAIVVTNYRRAAKWAPKPLSTGDGALALLAHTIPARERPAECLRATRRAAEDAIVVKGDRGEAEDVVPLLLAELEARAA